MMSLKFFIMMNVNKYESISQSRGFSIFINSLKVLEHSNDVIEFFHCISRKQVCLIVDFAIGGFSVFINSISHKDLEHFNDVIEFFHCISRKQV